MVVLVTCKKGAYEEGNLKDYSVVNFSNEIHIQGDTLVFIIDYTGLNYVPLDNNQANVMDIQTYLLNYLPKPNYNIQCESFDIFSDLAENTNGITFTMESNEFIPDTLIYLFDNLISENTDLVFLIDKSGSMWNDIDYIKADIDRILANLPSNIRVSAAAYSDNICEPNWYHSMPGLTFDIDEVRAFIEDLQAGGGCSAGESVYDAAFKTISELDWAMSTPNVMIIIGDEPPLKGEYSNHSFEEVIELCKSKNVDLYPILSM